MADASSRTRRKRAEPARSPAADAQQCCASGGLLAGALAAVAADGRTGPRVRRWFEKLLAEAEPEQGAGR